MKKLNKEIRHHNAEKKKCLDLEKEIRYLREELARYSNDRRSNVIQAPQIVSQTISRRPSDHQPQQPSHPTMKE
jgi:cell shape-determining protein MreC